MQTDLSFALIVLETTPVIYPAPNHQQTINKQFNGFSNQHFFRIGAQCHQPCYP
jgi:hypothetical protein